MTVLFFVVVVFLVAFSLGKTRILLAVLSVYIAGFLEFIFPFNSKIQPFFVKSDWLGLAPAFWLNLSVFLIIFLISLAILNRSILKPKMSLQESSPFTILFLSILVSGFLTSLIFSYLLASLPAKSNFLATLSPWLLKYFATKNAQFVWAVLPLLAMMFLRRKRVV